MYDHLTITGVVSFSVGLGITAKAPYVAASPSLSASETVPVLSSGFNVSFVLFLLFFASNSHHPG